MLLTTAEYQSYKSLSHLQCSSVTMRSTIGKQKPSHNHYQVQQSGN